MRALSVQQPYASMIAIGTKKIEFRSWPIEYRGSLLICSSASPKIKAPALEEEGLPAVDLPAGFALCIVDLVDCRPRKKQGGYAWFLKNPREIMPFRVKGRQRIFNLEVTPEPLPEGLEDHLKVNYEEIP